MCVYVIFLCESPGCTFGVIEMDGFKIVEPYFLIKLIKHGLHSSLCSQVMSYQDKKQHFTTKRMAIIIILIFVAIGPVTVKRISVDFMDKNIHGRFHSPAAKAWQVSRHTPTLVWSLTLSIMLFSSENLPPTVLP